jgi:SAM-dependent methyltransferase
MKPTHKILLESISQFGKLKNPKVLDFGCGRGEILQKGILKGIDFFGVEYAGPGSHVNLSQKLLNQDKILLYDGLTIPFDNDTFDVVISNQVFEHIPDFSNNLIEIYRVLKPEGIFINFFPHKHMLYEVHSRGLLLNYFNNKRIRYFLLWISKKIGMGRRKKERNTRKWIEFWLNWIPENTIYKSKSFTVESYKRAGFLDVNIKSQWYAQQRRKSVLNLSSCLSEKLYGLFIIATK